ncbi:MAG: hypothetical protein JWN40_4417 [Phycisphaerales bacterium]|nr:hypothetical protein [Phycisphaerales bacterium]
MAKCSGDRPANPSSIFHPPSSFSLSLPFVLFVTFVVVLPTRADEPPVIPIGADAYRMWERWPYQRIGARAYMRSTYDRRGGNEAADASHFLYQLADDNNVTLDIEGPGVFYFARYNHWHGSPWRYVVDGQEQIVRETSSADPTRPVPQSIFEPRELFPPGLTWTWSTTKGADLSWVPIGFERSFQMGYSRTCYGTGYYIYHQYVRGAKLSRSIVGWDAKTPPEKEIIDVIARAGEDLSPREGTRDFSGQLQLPEKAAATLDVRADGPAVVRLIRFSVAKEDALSLSNVRLRITWDGRPAPSVDAPLPLFFGAGTLYNRDDKEWLVKALPVGIRFDEKQVHLACYFLMPFFKSAKVELVNGGPALGPINWAVKTVPYTDPANHVGYFHATYADHGPDPKHGEDLLLLDTRRTEGGGDWTGAFIGTSFIFSHNARLGTLEGDPRFYFDDSMTPQGQGTGTEEWGGGGDYWGGRTMTLPLAGHPVGAPEGKAKDDLDKIESAYRFLLADLFPFGKNARITLEHGGQNDSKERYETVTYWYGLPGASLIKTDALNIGDDASERSHTYHSPQASQPYEIVSRYEWGVDSLGGKQIYPAHRELGRRTTGVSDFIVKIEPSNLGVMLRRTLDYQFPNQRAEVFIADASDAKTIADADYKPAGAWYLAGSNTCVFSRPKGEMDPPAHTVQTSNRRFRDDEFLVPRDLTQGRPAIAVRVKFTPVNIPLFPGREVGELAWSEIRYAAYCFVMPAPPHAP